MEDGVKIKRKFYKIKEEQEKLGREIKEKTMGYILAALGFVVGLAWNDAIKSVIEYIFPLDKNSILAKIIYALLITIVVVVATAYVLRSSEKKDK